MSQSNVMGGIQALVTQAAIGETAMNRWYEGSNSDNQQIQ
jgi:hypothetical protein